MSAATQPDVQSWTRAHRAVLVVLALAMALATAGTLVVVGLPARTASGTGSETASVHVPAVDDGCAVARSGQPC